MTDKWKDFNDYCRSRVARWENSPMFLRVVELEYDKQLEITKRRRAAAKKGARTRKRMQAQRNLTSA